MEHLIHLNGYKAICGEEGTLTLGTKDSFGIETLKIDADEAWDGLIVTAVFVAGNSRTKSVLKSDNTIVVPPEATAVSTHITLNRIVFSGEKNGVRRVTCDLPYVVCNNSGYDGNNSIDPTPSEYAQFVAQVKDNADRAEAAATKIPDPDGKTDKVLTVQNGKYVIDDPLRINDGAINREDVWSSKQVVDTFAPEFKVTGNPVTCDPVVNYPLSITVKGKTTQEGSGDPTPENIRPLSGVGQKMATVVIDGVTVKVVHNEQWTNINEHGLAFFYVQATSMPTPVKQMTQAINDVFPMRKFTQTATGEGIYVLDVLYIAIYKSKLEKVTSTGMNKWLAKNPLVVHYIPEDESKDTDFYTWASVENSDGSVYRGGGLELNSQLFDGDSVVNDADSGCDMVVTFDGSDDEKWGQMETAAVGKYRYNISLLDAMQADINSGLAYCNILPLLPPGDTWSNKPGFTVTAGQLNLYHDGEPVSEWKTFLNKNPITISYRTTSYVQKNDVRAILETHNDVVYTLTGDENYTQVATWKPGAIYLRDFMTEAVPVSGTGTVADINCSHAPTNKPSSVANEENVGCGQGGGEGDPGTSLYLNFGSLYNTKELAVQYIKDQYAAGTPIQIKTKRAIPAVYAHPAVKLPAPEGTVTVKAENTCDVTGRQTAQAAYNQLLSMVTAMQTHITGV